MSLNGTDRELTDADTKLNGADSALRWRLGGCRPRFGDGQRRVGAGVSHRDASGCGHGRGGWRHRRRETPGGRGGWQLSDQATWVRRGKREVIKGGGGKRAFQTARGVPQGLRRGGRMVRAARIAALRRSPAFNLNSEIRISETRKKPEIRRPNPTSALRWKKGEAPTLWNAAFRPSGFGFLSDLGFRTSGFRFNHTACLGLR